MELALEKGTVINQKYMVEKKLETKVKNQINYLCIEIKTKKQVLVKEFCPAYALRDENGHMKLGESDLNEYASFLNKNRMAEKFQTIPTLMSVLEVFEANNTCYAVCEYVQGETVERLIKKGGEFTKNAVKNMLLNLLKTNEILAGFGYMINDFFPNNVIITDLGDVKICEFNIEEKRAAEPKSLKSLVVLAYYMLTGVAIKSKTSARKLQKPFMDKMERYLLNVAAAESHEVSISDFTAAVNSNFENAGLRIRPCEQIKTSPFGGEGLQFPCL